MKRSHGLFLAVATMIGLLLATSLITYKIYNNEKVENERTENV